jgi:hypothetical protein
MVCQISSRDVGVSTSQTRANTSQLGSSSFGPTSIYSSLGSARELGFKLRLGSLKPGLAKRASYSLFHSPVHACTH